MHYLFGFQWKKSPDTSLTIFIHSIIVIFKPARAGPIAIAEDDAAALILVIRCCDTAGDDVNVDVGRMGAKVPEARDQPAHRKSRALFPVSGQ